MPARVLLILAAAGLAGVLYLLALTESAGALSAPGGFVTGLARLFAFTGTYGLVIMVLLAARLPVLERLVGQDRLVRWHRTIGAWPLVAIGLHIVLVTVGYAETTSTGVLHEFVTLLFHYPDVMASAVGFGLMVMAAVTSHRIIRQRLAYETWWVVHLYLYLGLGLAFAHQFRNGVVFLTHSWARAAWISAAVAVAVVVLASRLGRAALFNLRHQLRVAAVSREAPGVYSVTIEGRHIQDLQVAGGQFFQWRFLARGLWWHAHPYSLSAMPRPPYLRLTVKSVGDASGAIAHLKAGTRVWAEGPYGAFTASRVRRANVTLIGAGVGVTPLIALLEHLPADTTAHMLVRASTSNELIHRDELAELVARHGGTLHELVGPRQKVRLDSRQLRQLVPGIASSDVFVCGPAEFTASLRTALSRAGVPSGHIHVEEFAF